MPEQLPTPEEVLGSLFDDNPRLSMADGAVVTNELVERQATAPGGTTTPIVDSVLALRRVVTVE